MGTGVVAGHGAQARGWAAAELPVRHESRRQGPPYTLVLTKTDALFTRATHARDQAVTDLAWLTSTWG